MYNYLGAANRYGIRIKPKLYDEVIKNYKINKDGKYVRVEYFSTRKEDVELETDTLAKLQLKQEENFDFIYEKVKKTVVLTHAAKDSMLTLNIALAIAGFYLGNIGIGIANCCMAASQFVPQDKYSLKKEMDLVKWILDNRENVNNMIREEIESLMDEQLNYNYPEDTIYSEQVYKEGINLNNMDSLVYKDLKQIKKKTKVREKRIKRSV